MKYYLESLEQEKVMYSFKEFDKEVIKQCILNFFTLPQNKNDELWFYKVEGENDETVGDTYLGSYVFHKGNVAKEVNIGRRTFYKKIQ